MRLTGFDDVKAVSFQSLGETTNANQLLVIDDQNRKA